MKTKLTALCALILLAALLLVGCGGNKTQNPTDTTPATDPAAGGNVTEPTDTDAAELPPDLEPIDYDGRKITIMQRGDTGESKEEWDPEKEEYETLQAAMVSRNEYLKSKYNIEFEYKHAPALATDAAPLIGQPLQTGEHVFDFISYSPNFTAGWAQKGFLRTVQSVPNIDLSKSWWYPELNGALSYRDTNFFVVGALNISALWRANCIYYNKTLATSVGIEGELYEMVNNHEWTYEQLLEAAGKFATIDTTDDGPSMDDYYAISQTPAGWYVNFYGTGMSFTTRDSEGRWVVSNGGENATNRIEALVDLMNNEEMSLPLDGEVDQWLFFANGHALFLEESICVFRAFSGEDSDLRYGILPSPLYQKGQENYYTFIHTNHSSAISIPNGLPESDLDMIGRILEDSAYKAQQVQWPAFYNDLLKGKAAQDPQSAKMIEYIFSNLTLDPAMVYATEGSLDTAIRNVIANPTLSVDTNLRAAVLSTQNELGKVMDMIDEILFGSN